MQGIKKKAFQYKYYQSGLLKLPFSVVLLLFITLSKIYGQISGQLVSKANLSDFNYSISFYNAKHGLPQNLVDDLIYLDELSALLISTANGLTLFDGYSFIESDYFINYHRVTYFRDFYKPNPEWPLYASFPNFDGNSQMMVLKKDTFQQVFSFHAVDFKPDRLIIVNTDNRMIQLSKSGDTLAQRQMQIPEIINFVYSLSEEEVFFGTKNGLFKTKWVADSPAVKVSNISVKKCEKIPHQQAFILIGDEKVQRLDSLGQLTDLLTIESRKSHFSDFLWIDKQLFITSHEGLYVLEEGHVSHYSTNDILPTNFLNKIYSGPDNGVIFIGTNEKGFLKLEKKAAYTRAIPKEITNESFGSITQVSEGKIWMNTTQFVYELADSKEVRKRFSSIHLISSLSVIDSFAYLGMYEKKIMVIPLADPDSYYYQENFPGFLHGAYKDSKGKIWAGLSKGVFRGVSMDSLVWIFPNLINKPFISFYEASNGDIWMGGYRLLLRFDLNGNLKNIWGEKDGLVGNEVRSFYEDDAGIIWIGTYKSGLFAFFEGELRSISEKRNCMLGADVFTLAPDQFGNLVISSDNGIRILPIKDLQAFLLDQKDYLIPVVLDESAGIYNTEFNGGFINNYYSPDGKLFYFPTMQGYVEFYSQDFKNEREDIHLHFSGIQIDGKSTTILPKIINRELQEIIFNFKVAHFTKKNNVYYQFKLLKNNKEVSWSQLTKNNKIKITYLEPGNYRLIIRAVDGFHLKESNHLDFSFKVPYYFYEEPMVIIAATFLLLTLFYSLLRRNFKARQEQIRQSLSSQNLIVELQLNAIHAQMNPHFIFNALNVVNSLILKKEQAKATSYLKKFSDLLRQFFRQSEVHFSTVKEEKELIDAYLNIQRIRLKENFDFEVICPPHLFGRAIPTVMIQPFVENSVVHGIAHKTGKGFISVRFEEVSGSLKVIVEDNGIGRKAAAKLKKGDSKTSLGLYLVSKKSELLRQQYDYFIELQTEDVHENYGTRVTLIFNKEQM